MSPYLALIAVSPQICARQPDWPASTQGCGFLDMLTHATEGEVPPALADFMAAGDAPVYMTFGSWMPKDLPDLPVLLRHRPSRRRRYDAIRDAGRQAVVVANISEQEHWAAELCRLGVAPKPARRRNVTPQALAAMSAENGVAVTVRCIDERIRQR